MSRIYLTLERKFSQLVERPPPQRAIYVAGILTTGRTEPVSFVILSSLPLYYNHMDLVSSVFSVLFAWLVFNAIQAIYRLYLHPLAKFSGPRAAALSTRWLHRLANTGKAEEEFERLHHFYGTYPILPLLTNACSLLIRDRNSRITDRPKRAAYHKYFTLQDNLPCIPTIP